MKAFLTLLLATLCLSAHLHAEEPVPVPVPLAPHAETAESKPHAESAEAAEPGSPAGGAAERSEAEGVSHAEPAERTEPAAPGGDAIQHSAFSTQHSPLSATVSLTDGSSLKGSLRHRFLPAESATLGRLRIDLSSVSSIAFEPDPAAAARVTFRNGDLVTATLHPKHDRLVLDTLLGPVPIPIRAVSSISFVPPHSAFSTQHSALLYHCTFDNPSAISSPAVGPAGTFLGGDFVPGKVGSALRVYSDERAAQVDFRPGDLGPRGTIEFWAKMEEATPESRFGDGGNPRFFCLWLKDDMDRPGRNPRSSYLQWSGNDGSGRSGLCAMVAGATATTEPGCGFRRYPGFLGDPAAWHHYAVVWDSDGVAGSDSVLALFVDGRRLASDGHDDLARGKNFLRFLETPVLLGFPQRTDDREPAARHVPFLIDEFKIWSEPKTSFSLP